MSLDAYNILDQVPCTGLIDESGEEPIPMADYEEFIESLESEIQSAMDDYEKTQPMLEDLSLALETMNFQGCIDRTFATTYSDFIPDDLSLASFTTMPSRTNFELVKASMESRKASAVIGIIAVIISLIVAIIRVFQSYNDYTIEKKRTDKMRERVDKILKDSDTLYEVNRRRQQEGKKTVDETIKENFSTKFSYLTYACIMAPTQEIFAFFDFEQILHELGYCVYDPKKNVSRAKELNSAADGGDKDLPETVSKEEEKVVRDFIALNRSKVSFQVDDIKKVSEITSRFGVLFATDYKSRPAPVELNTKFLFERLSQNTGDSFGIIESLTLQKVPFNRISEDKKFIKGLGNVEKDLKALMRTMKTSGSINDSLTKEIGSLLSIIQAVFKFKTTSDLLLSVNKRFFDQADNLIKAIEKEIEEEKKK